jgi:hypothetical protein
LKFVFLFSALTVSAAAVLFLALKMVSLFLLWQDIPPLSDLNRDMFEWKLDYLFSVDLPSRLLFAATVFSAALFAFFTIKSQHRSGARRFGARS